MIHKETLSNGRVKTYSDLYKIRKISTGEVYEDAVDVVEHEYEETDELLQVEEESEEANEE